MNLSIRNKQTGEIEDLLHDARHTHSEWVHKQLGTESESELQRVIDQMHYEDYAKAPNKPDLDGVFMTEKDAEQYLDQRRTIAELEQEIEETLRNMRAMEAQAFLSCQRITEKLEQLGAQDI